MERLAYEDYQKYGGKCSVDDFPVLIIDCENCLNKITNNRIKELDSSKKRLIVRIIDEVLSLDKIDYRLTSYSDGIESFGYAGSGYAGSGYAGSMSSLTDEKIYHLCKQYLESDLLYRGINDRNNHNCEQTE